MMLRIHKKISCCLTRSSVVMKHFNTNLEVKKFCVLKSHKATAMSLFNFVFNKNCFNCNPSFVALGLPENFQSPEFKPPVDVPCIVELLCEKHEGLLIEAKGIKEHWWKPYIKKLFDKKVCVRSFYQKSFGESFACMKSVVDLLVRMLRR